MDKRAAKRFKRQVARAKEHAKTSEPDVRTQEQIEADREASRPDLVRGNAGPMMRSTAASRRNPAATGSAAKTST